MQPSIYNSDWNVIDEFEQIFECKKVVGSVCGRVNPEKIYPDHEQFEVFVLMHDNDDKIKLKCYIIEIPSQVKIQKESSFNVTFEYEREINHVDSSLST